MNNISDYLEALDLQDRPRAPKLTEPSAAVVHFSQDFDLMRKKFLGMQNQMDEYKETIEKLTNQVELLRAENL